MANRDQNPTSADQSASVVPQFFAGFRGGRGGRSGGHGG